MSEDIQQKVSEELALLRSEVDKKNQDKEKIEKLNAALDIKEKANQELMAEHAKKQSFEEGIMQKYSELEALVSRPHLGKDEKGESKVHFKSFEKWIMSGAKNFTPEEAKYLRTDSNPEGGFLAPPDYRGELIKKVTESTPFRNFARILQTSSKEVIIPTRTTLAAGGWVGEGIEMVNSNSTYGVEKIPMNRLSFLSDVTNEMLQDAAFNMASELQSDAAEWFAFKEGESFVNGSGVNQPEGLMTNTNIPIFLSGNASELTADSLIAIQGTLKVGYERTFMLNQRTLHQHVRLLKDLNDNYLFQEGNINTPNRIAGVPYVLSNDMPDVGTDKFPIIFGDFRKAYWIIDGVNLSILRDDFTQAPYNKVRFVFNKRTGGQVVLPEAVVKLKIAV